MHIIRVQQFNGGDHFNWFAFYLVEGKYWYCLISPNATFRTEVTALPVAVFRPELDYHKDCTFYTERAVGRISPPLYNARYSSILNVPVASNELLEGKLRMGDRGSLLKLTLTELMDLYGISYRRKNVAQI